MKKITIFSFLILAVIFLFSGCTVNGKPDGGVYKTTDGGKNFVQKITIDQKNNIGNENILAMQFDPNNSETLYIGTTNSGILRSTNGGDSWVKDVNNFMSVTSIAIHPNNSQTIYIAAVKDGRGKILKTNNGGEQWDEIFTERNSGPMVLSLAIDPARADTIYAGDSLGGIYKSEDGGASWRNLFWAQSAVRKVVIDSVNSSILYFATSNNGALTSTDSGVTFTEIVQSGIVYNIEAHPYKEGVVYLSDKNGLQMSEDGGKNWKSISTLIKSSDLGTRGIAVDPRDDNTIYFASGQAFYKTSNAGQTWSAVQFNLSRSIDIIRINPNNTQILYLGTNNRSSGGMTLLPF
jgi:photosystem II stability/assembly factor-like uncharacterized protein